MTTVERIAHFAHQWLSEETKRHQTMWIWVDSHDRGKDLAWRMWKLYAGDFAQGDIPYDSLPTWAGNPETGNRVFLLSQPNHAEAVLVTMQQDNADMDSRIVKPYESELIYRLSGGKVSGVDELVYLDQQMKTEEFQVRVPDIFLVDMEEPYWEVLTSYIGSVTRLMLSDRVKKGPPVNAG